MCILNADSGLKTGLPQRLKVTFFEIFSKEVDSKWPAELRRNFKKVDFIPQLCISQIVSMYYKFFSSFKLENNLQYGVKCTSPI